MDCIVHGVTKSQMWLSNFHFILFSLSYLNISFLVCKIFAEKSSESPMEVPLYTQFSSVQFSSVAQSCPTLCNPIDCSTPGFPVHHQLPEFTQTHVHWVSDAIQPSHPLIPFSSHLQSFPSSGSFHMSQFFASDGQSIEVSASASVLSMNSHKLFFSYYCKNSLLSLTFGTLIMWLDVSLFGFILFGTLWTS